MVVAAAAAIGVAVVVDTQPLETHMDYNMLGLQRVVEPHRRGLGPWVAVVAAAAVGRRLAAAVAVEVVACLDAAAVAVVAHTASVAKLPFHLHDPPHNYWDCCCRVVAEGVLVRHDRHHVQKVDTAVAPYFYGRCLYGRQTFAMLAFDMGNAVRGETAENSHVSFLLTSFEPTGCRATRYRWVVEITVWPSLETHPDRLFEVYVAWRHVRAENVYLDSREVIERILLHCKSHSKPIKIII